MSAGEMLKRLVLWLPTFGWSRVGVATRKLVPPVVGRSSGAETTHCLITR